MSGEPNKDEYIRAEKYPVQEKAEQEVVGALLKAGVRGENMDAVLDAVEKLISVELWTMGSRIRGELQKLWEKGGHHDPVADLRLRQVVVLAERRAERSRHVSIDEARSYLYFLDDGFSYREIAYIFGRSTETVHRGARIAGEERVQKGGINGGWDDDGEVIGGGDTNKQTA